MRVVSISLTKQRAARVLALIGVGVTLAASAAPVQAAKPAWAHGPSNPVALAHETGHKVG